MTLYAAIGFGVLTIFIVAGLVYLRARGQERTRKVFVISNAGYLDELDLPQFQDTVRDDNQSASFYLDIYALRHHEKSGVLAQFCYEWSAVPAYAGQPLDFGNTRAAFYRGRLTSMAIQAIHNRLGNNQKVYEQETNRQNFRLVIIGTVITVLVISIVVLVMSGKVGV